MRYCKIPGGSHFQDNLPLSCNHNKKTKLPPCIYSDGGEYLVGFSWSHAYSTSKVYSQEPDPGISPWKNLSTKNLPLLVSKRGQSVVLSPGTSLVPEELRTSPRLFILLLPPHTVGGHPTSLFLGILLTSCLHGGENYGPQHQGPSIV